jgi:hypothetical protein
MNGQEPIGAAKPGVSHQRWILAPAKSQLRAFAVVGLFLLIGCTLILDFMHGIQLGQDQIAFQPVYRLRQSLAVAISRQHDPAPGGYLAYGSVVNVLSENGFALFDGDPGPHLDDRGYEALLNDGPRLDRIIRQARDVSIDPNLPPEVIKANELGLADYIYVAFRLFGDKISSLYYLLFLIMAVSCLIYVLQFRNSPFPLFLAALFLAELYILENYASSSGLQLNTVANSRLFSGPSLLPAVHVLLVLWQRLPLRPFTAAGVVTQSLIFSFLLSCRFEAVWQAAMIVAVAGGMAICLLFAPGRLPHKGAIGRLLILWPAVIFLLVVTGYSTTVSRSADALYAADPKNHLFWHVALFGILRTSPNLRSEYASNVWSSPDELVYAAVTRDINARNDTSSPIVRRQPDGQLTLDLPSGWSEYDKLAKSLTLRILYRHPLAVLADLPAKVAFQVAAFDPRIHNMRWRSFRVPAAIVTLAAVLCVAAAGSTSDRRTRRGALYILATVLLFAAVTPLIQPGSLSIGTLFCYLGAIAVLATCGIELLIRSLIQPETKAHSDMT